MILERPRSFRQATDARCIYRIDPDTIQVFLPKKLTGPRIDQLLATRPFGICTLSETREEQCIYPSNPESCKLRERLALGDRSWAK